MLKDQPAKPMFLKDKEHRPLVDFLQALIPDIALDRDESSIKLTLGRCPWMRYQDERADHFWVLFQKLEAIGLFSIASSVKKRDLDLPDYLKRKICVPKVTRSVLCDWFDIEDKGVKILEWTAFVEQYSLPDSLKIKLYQFPNKSLEDLARACSSMLNDQSVRTLYQFSARYFWGDSKYLSGNRGLVDALLEVDQIMPRKALLHFYLPDNYTQLLLVENLDTYSYLVDSGYAESHQLSVAYMAGYKGTEQGIRQPDNHSVHWHPSSMNTDELKNELLLQWQSGFKLPVYYWGDLDAEGLNIYLALKQQLPEIQVWQPGYQALMNVLDSGCAHRKEKQRSLPEKTDSDWLNHNVLPILRDTGLSVDQEVVDLEQI